MDWQTVLNAFTLIFVTIGPIKVLIVYAEKTGSIEHAVRKWIAIEAVTIATVIGIVFIVAGKFLMDLFKFSIGSLTIAGGLILLIFAINLVAFLTEERLLNYISPEVLQVAERVLGILLAALAVQTIFNGLVDLWLQYGDKFK